MSRGSIEVLATAPHEFGRAGLWCRRRLAIGLLERGFRSAGLQRQRDAMLRLLCAMLAATPATASCVFENARLYNESGHTVTCDDLGGLSVALYFAGEWCPLCRRFTPALRAFREKWSGSVQIVFISSDFSEAAMKEHYAHQLGGWIALAWDDPLAATLKRRYKVWSNTEVGTFGFNKRSGVPAVVVIDHTGAELAFLPGERHGAVALLEWDPGDQMRRWPTKSEL